VARPQQGGQQQPAPPPPQAAGGPTPAAVDPNAEITAILGPWEPTIANVKPLDELNKAVADFLFLNVINSPDAVEIAQLGIAFEIEAKLGTVIDKDTNDRVAYPVSSECLLRDRGQFAFRSSMTEVCICLCYTSFFFFNIFLFHPPNALCSRPNRLTPSL
jgi:hypothetical protein